MQLVRLFSALLFSLLAAACADLPTSTDGRDGAKIAAAASGPSQALDPVVVVGTCDPYLSLDRCGQEEDCMTSTDVAPALGDFSTLAGCGGGGSGGGTGDAGGTGGGGGGSGGTTAWSNPTPHCFAPDINCDGVNNDADGPMAWGACIIVVAGAVVSVDVVAEAFTVWYDAALELDEAKRMRDMVYANSGQVSTEMLLIYDTRLDIATNAYKDARLDVSLATGASILALVAAAFACSPALVLPTA